MNGTKVPAHIRNKLHKIADLHFRANELTLQVENWLEKRGFDIEDLRDGCGCSLEEFAYGNDITDAFCDRLEQGEEWSP